MSKATNCCYDSLTPAEWLSNPTGDPGLRHTQPYMSTLQVSSTRHLPIQCSQTTVGLNQALSCSCWVVCKADHPEIMSLLLLGYTHLSPLSSFKKLSNLYTAKGSWDESLNDMLSIALKIVTGVLVCHLILSSPVYKGLICHESLP